MAQLVKLYHYISRYELDVYYYPTQFLRLKKKNWEKKRLTWNPPEDHTDSSVEEEKSWWEKFLNHRSKKEETEQEDASLPVVQTEQEKKQAFLDSLFPFQLKWASTTKGQMSFLDNDFKRDATLKYFLQRFPDTYLLFYQPVFSLKRTPMETDILLVGPFGIDIIKVIENNCRKVYFTATDERMWIEHSERGQKKIASPLLSLNRTEKVIKGILKLYGNDFPVHKVVLSRTNKVEASTEAFNTSYIDSRQHTAWLEKKRTNAHLLKHRQLRVCELLLSHCDRVAFRRPEWEEKEEDPEKDL